MKISLSGKFPSSCQPHLNVRQSHIIMCGDINKLLVVYLTSVLAKSVICFVGYTNIEMVCNCELRSF